MKKRQVTMTSVVYAGKDLEGNDLYRREQSTDFISVEPEHADHLDKYVADAKTRWQHVEVGDVIDHDDEYTGLPEHIVKGVSLDDHLDSLGIPNRTDAGNITVIPPGGIHPDVIAEMERQAAVLPAVDVPVEG